MYPVLFETVTIFPDRYETKRRWVFVPSPKMYETNMRKYYYKHYKSQNEFIIKIVQKGCTIDD